MHVKSNEKEKTLDFYEGTTLIKQLTQEEAWAFFSNVEKEKEAKGHLFHPNWTEITIEDIENEIPGNIDEVVGLEFDLTCYHNFFPSAYVGLKVDLKGPHVLYEYLEETSISENFNDADIYFGKITNHALRACLSDELREYIMDQPGFKIKVSEKEVNLYDFFDEENSYYYKPILSSDT